MTAQGTSASSQNLKDDDGKERASVAHEDIVSQIQASVNLPTGRPRIKKYKEGSKFQIGDKVFLSIPGVRGVKGPYLVASVPSAGVYDLSQDDGTAVENGTGVLEKDLKLVEE